MHPATSPPARHDHAAVAYNNKMYIFGGEDASGHSLSDVWAFDPIADTWTQQPSLAGPQAWPGGFNAVAVTIGQQIILYGGKVITGGSSQPDAHAYAYNPSTGAWTRLAADPLGGDVGPTGAAYNGKLYVFSSTSSTIESLDPVQDVWTPITVQGTTPTPRAHAAGAAISSLFWMTGGAGTTGDTWEFNFNLDTWVQKASFPDAGVSDQGATTFFHFGLPLFGVFGGEVNAGTNNGYPNSDVTAGRFQGDSGITSVDNFPAGLPNLVVPHIVVAEPGGTVTYALDLFGTGSPNITVPISSTNPAEGTVSPAQVVLPAFGTSTPAITITGGSDTAQDGDVLFQIQYGPVVSSDPDWSGLTEYLPVVARDVPTFSVGTFGSYVVTSRYSETLESGTLPMPLQYDPATDTISGTPAAGTAGTYPLTFQGEDPSSTFTLALVVQAANNPAPTLTAISPRFVPVGAPAATINLTGTNFISSSTVDLNGTPLATTFVSSTQLSALVPASHFTAAGPAKITVVTPGPGGGQSSAQILHVGTQVADYFGTGISDFGYYNPTTATFHVAPPLGGNKVIDVTNFGGPGWVPTDGDYDGNGKVDIGLYNAAAGVFVVFPSGGAKKIVMSGLGGPGAQPLSGDFFGDGKTDFGYYNPVTATFYVAPEGANKAIKLTNFGGPGWVATSGDYDGDGKTGIGLYNAAAGTFVVIPSSGGKPIVMTGLGGAGAQPLSGDYFGDGKTDFGYYNPTTATFYVAPEGGNKAINLTNFGGPGWVATAGDYDGDGKTDVSLYNAAAGVFVVFPSAGGKKIVMTGLGGTTAVPLGVPAEPSGIQTSSVVVTESVDGALVWGKRQKRS
jgi:hypothetical protein